VKARWFAPLPLSYRMDTLYELIDLAAAVNPAYQDEMFAYPIAGRIQVVFSSMA
jgi:hypothetical protein